MKLQRSGQSTTVGGYNYVHVRLRPCVPLSLSCRELNICSEPDLYLSYAMAAVEEPGEFQYSLCVRIESFMCYMQGFLHLSIVFKSQLYWIQYSSHDFSARINLN